MKIGIVGTGPIVETFLEAVNEINDIECIALCSRNKGNRSNELIERYNIKKLYDNYDDFLNDIEIEFVYIALPNSLHYSYSLKALNKDKNVICEKAFTSTVEECTNLIKVAREKGLYLFEGITTIHLPNFIELKNHLHRLEGIKLVQCNYSQFSSRYELLQKGDIQNIFSLEFSGGALYDINIYNLHFVTNLFGKAKQISYIANTHKSGIDTSGILNLRYDDFLCQCIGAKDSASEGFAYIQGKNGYIKLYGPTNECPYFEVVIDNNIERYNLQKVSNRVVYELVRFKEIYQNKDFKMSLELLDHSLDVMKLIVKARKTAGIEFTADKQGIIN